MATVMPGWGVPSPGPAGGSGKKVLGNQRTPVRVLCRQKGQRQPEVVPQLRAGRAGLRRVSEQGLCVSHRCGFPQNNFPRGFSQPRQGPEEPPDLRRSRENGACRASSACGAAPPSPSCPPPPPRGAGALCTWLPMCFLNHLEGFIYACDTTRFTHTFGEFTNNRDSTRLSRTAAR